MLDLIPVATVTHEGTKVVVEHATSPIHNSF